MHMGKFARTREAEPAKQELGQKTGVPKLELGNEKTANFLKGASGGASRTRANTRFAPTIHGALLEERKALDLKQELGQKLAFPSGSLGTRIRICNSSGGSDLSARQNNRTKGWYFRRALRPAPRTHPTDLKLKT